MAELGNLTQSSLKAMPGRKAASYRESLQATSVTGATSLVEVGVQMVKSKVTAVCIGPEGIGLFGILSATTGLISTLCGFGLNGSGVRQIAAATATNDRSRIACIIYTLRRTSLATGLLGMSAVLLFAGPLSRLITGTEQYAGFLLLLAPMVLFNNVNGGQTALLRGLRRIGDLARLRILGAVAGTVLGVPLIWIYGLHGVAPAMLVTALVSLGASWWYARRIRLPALRLPFPQILSEAGVLFGLGAAFLITGLQNPLVQNAQRAILMQYTDLHTVGQFLAAMALSHVYVNFILNAMGMDYLPRLTRHKDTPAECNRLVNEQTEVALLLAVPGVTTLVVAAPLLIPLLYSHRFDEAIEVFRWQCLGVLLKVASWPLGFVLIAQGRRTAFLVTETMTNVIYVSVFYLLVRSFGLTGAALAFAVVYLWYLSVIFYVVRRGTGFMWSAAARCLLLTGLGTYALAAAASLYLPSRWHWAVGLTLVLASVSWSYRQLCRRVELPLAGLVLKKIRVFTKRRRVPDTSCDRPT
jgi:antigen flippase